MNIKELIKLGENKVIEFKKSENAIPKDVWSTYSAFANTDGGIIILGVSEDNGKFKITGINNPDKLLKDFWDSINNSSTVNKNILKNNDVSIIEIDGKAILKIDVPRAKFYDRPISKNENPYIGTYKRNHSGDYKCTKAEVNSFIRNSASTLDEDVLDNFTFEDDIDLETLVSYKNRYSFSRDKNHPWTKLKEEEFLVQIGGAKKNKETKKIELTIAGLLMFGKTRSIEQIFPRFYLDFFDKSSGLNERWDDRVWYDGSWGESNIYNFYFTVTKKLYKNLKIPFKMANDGYTRVDTTPAHTAVREAFVNMLVHADYTGEATTKAIMYSDRYEFYNPGLLRISKEEIFKGGNSYPRNSNVMRMFQYINIGERAGSGFPKILSAVKEYHWKAPEIEENNELNFVKVTLWIDEVMEAKKVEERKSGRTEEWKNGTNRALNYEKTLEDFLKKNIDVSAVEAQELLFLSRSRVVEIMKKMIDDGIIEKIGKGKNTKYILKIKRD